VEIITHFIFNELQGNYPRSSALKKVVVQRISPRILYFIHLLELMNLFMIPEIEGGRREASPVGQDEKVELKAF
jgi:hypothetical protein